MDAARCRRPRGRPKLAAAALAQLVASAAGLRAYPVQPRLACSPEPALGSPIAAGPPAHKHKRGESPAQPGPAGRAPKEGALCRAEGWVQEAADCKFREGPGHFQRKFGGFWNGTVVGSAAKKPWTCPLTVASLRRAARPYGHEGARLRLRLAMDRLRRGHNITVAVIGQSMTMGTQTQRSWPKRLQDLFERLKLPVTVRNLAKGGTNSEWAVSSFWDLQVPLSSADVVMVDYGLNDRENGQHDLAAIKKDHHNLVKLLVSLPNKPGIVDVQTFMETPLILSRFSSEVPTNDCSAVDLRKYHHWSVNEELNVPMISYTEAVCGSNRTWWMMEFKDVESQGSPHPGVITHDLLARVALGFFLGELETVCQQGVAGEDFEVGLEMQLGSHIQCLLKPTTIYNAKDGNASFQPASVDQSAWFFGADVPGKPLGWIARSQDGDEGARAGDLVFELETRSGWIQMEYLGTYENIGSIEVRLDNDGSDSSTCRVDGLWTDHTSQSKFSVLKAGVSPGMHKLWIRSNGQKFKLLSIAAC